MPLTVQVFFLPYSRPRNLLLNLRQLRQVSSHLRKHVRLVFLGDGARMHLRLLPERALLFMAGFKSTYVATEGYLGKARVIAGSRADVIIKCDEDIFLTSAVWNQFLSESMELLKNGESLVISPNVSTGVPSVESFIDCFFEPSLVSRIRKIFEETVFPREFLGAPYHLLNGKYRTSQPSEFFSEVAKLPSRLKGVHPVRFSALAQHEIIAGITSSERWKFPLSKRSYPPKIFHPVYFCNSIFACPSGLYRRVISGIDSGQLFSDGFDELALNQFMVREKIPLVIFQHLAAVHPSYNTIGEVDHFALSHLFAEFAESFSNKKA